MTTIRCEEPLDGLYLGRGGHEVAFRGTDPLSASQFYLLSYPAHPLQFFDGINLGILPSYLLK
jgi:5-keto 4-deoxyuronate isomerase